MFVGFSCLHKFFFPNSCDCQLDRVFEFETYKIDVRCNGYGSQYVTTYVFDVCLKSNVVPSPIRNSFQLLFPQLHTMCKYARIEHFIRIMELKFNPY